jgi:predicted dehydrogenase
MDGRCTGKRAGDDLLVAVAVAVRMTHAVCIIGLGIMGQRMLANMHAHQRFTVVTAWDPEPAACARTAARYPELRIAGSAAEAIDDARVGVVYIACPPAWHREHALASFAAGKAVYCEKPLGVDVSASADLVDAAARSRCCNIVNFSLASAAATREVEAMLGAGALGDLAGVDVYVHFSRWPREWQAGAAAWLSRREQGGFTREVLSHWIYLSERLFGPLTLDGAQVRYPGDGVAESHVLARLSAGALPVIVAGSVGGVGPDAVEYTIWGAQRSCRIHDWNRLRSSSGGAWSEQLAHLADPRQTGYMLQLDNAAAALSGQAHSMPGFADALRVQRIVEDILRA